MSKNLDEASEADLAGVRKWTNKMAKESGYDIPKPITKASYDCKDCGRWKKEEGVCGIWSGSCINSKSRPYFLFVPGLKKKNEEEKKNES